MVTTAAANTSANTRGMSNQNPGAEDIIKVYQTACQSKEETSLLNSQVQFLRSLKETLPEDVLCLVERAFNPEIGLESRKLSINGVLNNLIGAGEKIDFLKALKVDSQIASYAEEKLNRLIKPL